MTEPQSSIPSLLEQLAQIAATLRAAQDVLAHGGMPDLRGLDHRMADLCAEVEAVKGPARRECVTELHGVVETLDACKIGLIHWRELNPVAASDKK